ncbi:MAG: MGMT family protein [Oscillospiraceae bacterium]|nr:MGMT family protein [Ruminococcus sp.]MCD8345248.1 MGMT family protein [Oscillospiraceae bacterium]
MSSFDIIYETVKLIPKGKVATYGQVATISGNPRWSRVVGYALHRNPEPGVIPCHRVVMKDGSLTPAFAFGGESRQREMLESEGVEFLTDGRVDMGKCRWETSQSAFG